MEVKYFIQNIETKEYFCRYRIDSWFSLNIYEARDFDSKEEAIKVLSGEDMYSEERELFEDGTFEIKEYYKSNC